MTVPDQNWLDPYADENGEFPGNVIQKFKDRMEMEWGVNVSVELRPLLPTDPNFSIGIYDEGWRPDKNTFESGRVPETRQATIQRFPVMVQCLVRDSDKELGLRNHSIFSALIRRLLADDLLLRISLEGLTTTVGTDTKVLLRWYVDSADNFTGQPGGELVFLSENHVVIEVEKK